MSLEKLPKVNNQNSPNLVTQPKSLYTLAKGYDMYHVFRDVKFMF
jgi:ABC-type transporter Mla MlaB component